MKKRLVLLLISLLAFQLIFVMADETGEVFDIKYDDSSGKYVNYEYLDVDSEFLNIGEISADAYGFSFINSASKVMVVESPNTKENAFKISSFADMRMWSLNIPSEDYYMVKAKVEFNEVEGQEAFMICITAEISSDTSEPVNSNSESTLGRVIVIGSDEAGNPTLNNNGNEYIMTLEKNKVYTLGVIMEVDSDKYDIFLDDKVVSRGNTFLSIVDKLISARIDVSGQESEVLLSEFEIREAWAYNLGPTPEPTNTPEPTKEPEETEKPIETTKAPTSETETKGKNTGLIIALVIVAIVVVAVVVFFVLKKSKKK